MIRYCLNSVEYQVAIEVNECYWMQTENLCVISSWLVELQNYNSLLYYNNFMVKSILIRYL